MKSDNRLSLGGARPQLGKHTCNPGLPGPDAIGSQLRLLGVCCCCFPLVCFWCPLLSFPAVRAGSLRPLGLRRRSRRSILFPAVVCAFLLVNAVYGASATSASEYHICSGRRRPRSGTGSPPTPPLGSRRSRGGSSGLTAWSQRRTRRPGRSRRSPGRCNRRSLRGPAGHRLPRPPRRRRPAR